MKILTVLHVQLRHLHRHRVFRATQTPTPSITVSASQTATNTVTPTNTSTPTITPSQQLKTVALVTCCSSEDPQLFNVLQSVQVGNSVYLSGSCYVVISEVDELGPHDFLEIPYINCPTLL